MENENLIPLEQLCLNYHIEPTFINALTEFGLMEITTVEATPFISKEQVKNLEQLIHLHYDLEINMEGIDAIRHLLDRIDQMQTELLMLRNRLRLYESDDEL